ncbi:phage tail tube protein [Microbacterium terrisoli]|uniref:phage tail tube protein n=1 Tax=Microbacterium terrisoli TaxID=3242192 RepID=UPI0028048ADB|nr:hypothetical protein [Microbacterium protaetiae]
MTRAKVTPGSVASDDNLLVLFVPSDGVASKLSPKVSELTAATVKDITYNLTGDGFTPGGDQATVTDDRLTLGQTLERPGRETKSLTIKRVYGASDDVADAVLTKGVEGSLYIRWAVPYTDDIAADDIFEVWPIQAGSAMKDAPTANGVFTKTQKLFVTGEVEDATVSAT